MLSTHSHKTRLVFQFSTQLQSFTSQIQLGDPSFRAVKALQKEYHLFVDYLLQPIAKAQQSYLKDTTDFINFIEKTQVVENTVLVSMDVTSLYTNIPQGKGITTVRNAYETFY